MLPSPAGTRLISVPGDFPDFSPRLWDLTAGQLIKVMTGHTNRVQFVAFSPDGTRAVTASMDQTAWLWDGLTGESIASLRGHSGRLTQALFSPDGQYVVTASDDETLRLWDAKTGGLIAALRGHTAGVRVVAFTAEGTRSRRDRPHPPRLGSRRGAARRPAWARILRL